VIAERAEAHSAAVKSAAANNSHKA
jgi:hypothetical protein